MNYSIIVPIFNSEKYLERCLESLKNQTFKNIEIILIDDGSTDNSGNICNKYAKVDSRFKVIHQKNQGVSKARNKGIDTATGDFVLFVDSDDWVEIDMIQKVDNELADLNLDFLVFNTVNSKKSLIPCFIFDRNKLKKILKNLIISERINSPFCKIYKTDIIKQNNIKFKDNIPIGEDLFFNITYFVKIRTMKIIEDKLYNYDNDNTMSLSRKYNSQKYTQLMTIDRELDGIVKQFNDKKIAKAMQFIKIKNIFSCIIDLNRIECPYNDEEKDKYIKKMQNENKIGILIRLWYKAIYIWFSI